MPYFEPRGLGWLPSLPDFRDFTVDTPLIQAQLQHLRAGGPGPSCATTQVDLREYFPAVGDQQELKSSTAHACVGLIEYFERRAHARVQSLSRLFLHQCATRLSGAAPSAGADYRTAFKAMRLCGLPPENLWPYVPQQVDRAPDGFLYSFAAPYRSLSYVRLDPRHATGRECLQIVRACLASGFPAVFGLAIPRNIPRDGTISYRPTFDSVDGGQAMIAVGFDDHWLRSSRGALLVRSSWGRDWGENGYGWLPYAYVEERLATEFWTVFRADWVESGEFSAPEMFRFDSQHENAATHRV